MPARGVRSSELLGFAPDARVLIVNADDFGMYQAVNAAVVQSIEDGIASSCSLMVPCPWALDAMRLLRQRPEIPFGIHLTLVRDTGHHRWGPLTVALAGEYGLAVRVWLEPGRQRMRRRGLPVVDHDFLDSFALDLPGKSATYARLLRDLPAGLSEWAVHPGLGDAESQAIDSGWHVRQTDFEFLTSPEAREILQREQIVVIDYRSLQQAWS